MFPKLCKEVLQSRVPMEREVRRRSEKAIGGGSGGRIKVAEEEKASESCEGFRICSGSTAAQ